LKELLNCRSSAQKKLAMFVEVNYHQQGGWLVFPCRGKTRGTQRKIAYCIKPLPKAVVLCSLLTTDQLLIYMSSMLNGKDVDSMVLLVNFIHNPVIANPQGEFTRMIADKGFACLRAAFKRFQLFDYPSAQPSVGALKRVNIGNSLAGQLNAVLHHLNPYLLFTSCKETVCPERTCFFARPMASRSSLQERISSVSRSPSNSSLLSITALFMPFFVMEKRSYFSSTSLMIADRLFFASARGIVLVIATLHLLC
jgi:hypothetical protein